MPLPPRVFWTLTEVAARWGCSLADIAAWSAAGSIEIRTGVCPVYCGTQVVAGLVQVHAADIFPMFRRDGSGPRSCRVRRLRPEGQGDWLYITEPVEGVVVEAPDLVIMDGERQRFEDEHEIFGRASNRPGPDFKYGWVQLLQWLAVHLHEHGVPETQKELLDQCRDWLIANSPDGEHPTDRSIRSYITPVWKGLRREDAA